MDRYNYMFILVFLLLFITCGKNSTNPDNKNSESDDFNTLSCKIDVLGFLDFSNDVGSQYAKNIEFQGKFFNVLWCRGDTKLNDKTIYLVFELWNISNLKNDMEFNISQGRLYDDKGFWLHVTHIPDGIRSYELESGILKLETLNANMKTATGNFSGSGNTYSGSQSGHSDLNQPFKLTDGKFSIYNIEIIGQ